MARGHWLPDRARFASSGAYGAFGTRSPTFSNAGFDALRIDAGSLAKIFAFSRLMPLSAAIHGHADASSVQLVSGAYFTGLRLNPAIGRTLTTADDTAASQPAAVIRHRFWQRRFDGDPAAVGTAVALDGLRLTIVGVAPRGFRGVASAGASGPDFWIPLAFGSHFGPLNTKPDFWWLSVMGRMQPDATVEQVRGNLCGDVPRGGPRNRQSPA